MKNNLKSDPHAGMNALIWLVGLTVICRGLKLSRAMAYKGTVFCQETVQRRTDRQEGGEVELKKSCYFGTDRKIV